jgi:hypothetical protein
VALDVQKETVETLAERAATDERVLSGLLEAIVSKKDAVRYHSFKALLLLSEEHPEALLPEWGFFADLLSSDNAYHRSTGINIIGNLTGADEGNRFEELCDRYFGLLDDESVVVARYVARNAGRIARSKPHLQKRITQALLDIDETHRQQERKDLVKADAIQSFGEFFTESPDKERILAFVEEQLGCSGPTTRKAAKAFLKKWGGQ